MRRLVAVLSSALLCGCNMAPGADAANNAAVAASEFPQAGEYHIVRDVTVGAVTNRYESDRQVDPSSPEKLLNVVAGSMDSPFCDGRQVTIKGGSFSIKRNCGASTVDTHGTYSTDSIDINYERTVDGTAHIDRVSYRLKD